MTDSYENADGLGMGAFENLPSQDSSPEDLYKMGLQYSTGQGVPMDYVCAHMLFNLAALMGSDDAKLTRKELSELMSTGEIATAQKAAREWLEKKKDTNDGNDKAGVTDSRAA